MLEGKKSKEDKKQEQQWTWNRLDIRRNFEILDLYPSNKNHIKNKCSLILLKYKNYHSGFERKINKFKFLTRDSSKL